MATMRNQDRRAQSRIPANLRAIESRDGLDRSVRVSNISEGGAFIVTESLKEIPPVGTALRMKLRLPVGFWICATVIVRWIRTHDSGAGYGVDFENLGEHERFFLRTYLQNADAAKTLLEANLSVKYRVDRDGHALVISIAGHLSDEDGDQLALELSRQRRLLSSQPTCVFVNASRFAASSRSALQRLSSGLRALSDLPNLAGILVEGTSVGRVQVRRLMREAGLSESLLCFENEQDASMAWSSLYAMQRGEANADKH